MATYLPDFDWPKSLPRTCSREMLFLGVKEWALGTKDKELAEILNIPVHAVKRFVNLPGWHYVVRQLRSELDQEVENRLQRNLRLTLNELEDRLHNGDLVRNRDGTVTRTPIPAAVLGSLAASLFDRRAHARKMTDGIPDAPQDVAESLKAIAEVLRKHNQFNGEAKEVIDVEDEAA